MIFHFFFPTINIAATTESNGELQLIGSRRFGMRECRCGICKAQDTDADGELAARANFAVL